MSKQMKALLKNRHAEQSNSPFVFPSNVTKTGYLDREPGTMRFVSEVAGTPVTLHDLRRGLTDVCAEVGIRPDRERMLLNHRALDVHAAHYSNSQRALTEDVQKIADWIAAAPV
jgi:integrase